MRRIVGYIRLLKHLVVGAKAERKEARYQLLSSLSKRWQMRIYQRDVTWHTDAEFLKILEKFPGNAGLTAKRYNLYNLARSIACLQGDTAECGVAGGISSYLIYYATAQPGRYHHGFDSFEGLPKPEKVDKPPKENLELKEGDFAVSLDEVQKNLASCENVRLHKGWIPERFRDVRDRKFVLVHIDVDFYKATFESIAFFYSRMLPGGMIICDDYGFSGTPGARKAFDKYLSDKPESIIKLASGQAIIIKS